MTGKRNDGDWGIRK